jgi:hypothetical protein
LIVLNKAGKSFFREEDVACYGVYSFFDAFFAQEDHLLWTVSDDKSAQKNRGDIAPPVTEKDCAFTAPTLPELAKLIQVPEMLSPKRSKNTTRMWGRERTPNSRNPKIS